ncbi:MAG: hypothetical protein D6776_10565 [Planctomycetota bacterium]|nr:MAG: hypothetical protein D6776_10565 [Planctomycetota bacterium]
MQFREEISTITVVLQPYDESRRAEVQLPPDTTVAELIAAARKRWRFDDGTDYRLVLTRRRFDENENFEDVDEELDPSRTLGSYGLPHRALLTLYPNLVAGAGDLLEQLREKRLRNERAAIEQLAARLEPLRVLRCHPEFKSGFALEFRCPGVTELTAGTASIGRVHRVTITYPVDFPRPGTAPSVRFVTPIRHPHVFTHDRTVCLGKAAKANEPLEQLAIRIGRLITCDPELFDPGSVADPDAARWLRSNMNRLPLGGARFGQVRRPGTPPTRPTMTWKDLRE